MKIKVYPGEPWGGVTPPCSKSMAHRAVFCAAMAEGESVLEGVDMSEDIEATVNVCRAMGADITLTGRRVTVRPFKKEGTVRAFCGQSGSTLRFALPAILARGGRGELTGEGRLMKRPMESYRELCLAHGWTYEQRDGLLAAEGSMKAGKYRLDRVVSSQFVSGMMMALGSLREESVIEYGVSPSAPYIKMTAEVIKAFGAFVGFEEGKVRVGGGYKGTRVAVEGDWSHGALWLAMGKALGRIECHGLDKDSFQGDRYMVWWLERGDNVLDCTDHPDLAPAAAAYGLFSGGVRLTNVGRLADKESDRATGIVRMINDVGGRAERINDEIIIYGGAPRGGRVAVDDHRMAMMAAFMACGSEEGIVIEGAECVAKSYPDFWRHLAALGIKTEVSDEKA